MKIGYQEIIVGGGLLAIVGLSIKTHLFATQSKDDQDKKIGRVYQKIDEERDKNDKKFVALNVCQVLHKGIKDDVGEIKTDIKELLRRNGGGQ